MIRHSPRAMDFEQEVTERDGWRDSGGDSPALMTLPISSACSCEKSFGQLIPLPVRVQWCHSPWHNVGCNFLEVELDFLVA